MRNRRRMQRQLHADQLQIALEHGHASHPRTDELVETAQLLRSGVLIRESKRAENKARMLAAFREQFTAEARPDAGTLDSANPGRQVHAAEVDLPDGHVSMADVEKISAEDAARIAREVAMLDRLSEEL